MFIGTILPHWWGNLHFFSIAWFIYPIFLLCILCMPIDLYKPITNGVFHYTVLARVPILWKKMTQRTSLSPTSLYIFLFSWLVRPWVRNILDESSFHKSYNLNLQQQFSRSPVSTRTRIECDLFITENLVKLTECSILFSTLLPDKRNTLILFVRYTKFYR